MTDKIEEIRKRHEAGSGNLPIVGLAQAETDRSTLLGEVDRLRRHVDALQKKVVAESCACGYDSPDAVCLAHSPQLSAALVEVERLTRDSDVARAEIRRQVWHIGLLQEKIDAEKSCACGYDNPDDVCMKHSPLLVAARAEVERLHKEHEAACLGGELLRAENERLLETLRMIYDKSRPHKMRHVPREFMNETVLEICQIVKEALEAKS